MPGFGLACCLRGATPNGESHAGRACAISRASAADLRARTVAAMGQERIADSADRLGGLRVSMAGPAISSADGWLPIVRYPGFLVRQGLRTGAIARIPPGHFGAERPPGA